MINMQGVSKIFRTELIETQALRDFSLLVESGEFVAVRVIPVRARPRC